MNIYLVCTRGDYLDNQIVVCDKVEDIIKLAFNSDRENFLEYALITHLNNIQESKIIFDIGKDGVINNEEILLERLKANGIKEVSDYVKSNIREIYFNLNFRINIDQQYLHYPLEYQEEIKKIINGFRGHNLN